MSASHTQPFRRSFRRPTDDARIVRLVEALREAEADCKVVMPWGETIRLRRAQFREPAPPEAPPRFSLNLQNDKLLRSPITQLSLGRAYVRGDLDITVDEPDISTRVEDIMSVFRMRDALRSGTSVGEAVRFAAELTLSRPTRVNARAIGHHYSLGDDFYHTFLDPKYRFYSQLMFGERRVTKRELVDPSWALSVAAEEKLAHMSKALQLKRGMRILDVGGGWGGLMEYCNDRGVHVTALTISDDSEKYIRDKIRGKHSQVIREDLLVHRRREYYDAVVIFGVIEHIPTYRRFCARVWDALKPGGILYMDASATRQKYAASAFTRRYTWRGPHSCLALPDMIEELLVHGFEILDVQNGTRDYERTMRGWALRLEDKHEYIAKRWGEYVYRTFHVFLWGGAQGFRSNRLQAYTLVARRTKDRGPRPGLLQRAAGFGASLR